MTERKNMALSTTAGFSPGLPRMGRREVRAKLGRTFSQVHDGGAVEVINHGQRDVMLVAPAEFDKMLSAQYDADSLRASVAMLVAAASQGVVLPSETMDRLGVSSDPEKLKWFRTNYPVRFTHDEDGNALRPVPHLTTTAFDEDEDEIELVEDDV